MKVTTAILSAFTTLLFFAGCNTQQREIERLQVYSVRYPDQFKVLANTLDPCFPIKGKIDTVLKHDTTTTPGTTTIENVFRHDTLFITKTIKLPGQIVTNTITIHDTIPDNRSLEACQGKINIYVDSLKHQNQALQDETKKANKYSLWFWLIVIIEGVIIIGFIIYKIYGIVSGSTIINNIKKG